MSTLTKAEIDTSVLLGELIPMYHVCGGIAFYTTKQLIPNVDELTGSGVIRLDGTHPVDMVDYIQCGSCGGYVDGIAVSSEEFFYK